MPKRVRPVGEDFYVTSGYGPRWGTVHRGVDFGRNGGSAGFPVYAAQGGIVIHSGAASGFGGPAPAGWVVIDHPEKDGADTTVYGHVISEVRVGQRVEAGQRIARINPDQRTNGGVAPHLHFEVHRYVWGHGNQMDPVPWLARGSSPTLGANKKGSEMMSYFDVDWSSRFGFGGPRPVSGLRGVCIHTTENQTGTPAENVANYQLNTRTGSYHVLVDASGKRLRENTDDWITWSTGNQGNTQLVHLSFVTFSANTRQQWLAQETMLRAGASVVAHWCKKYGWPAQFKEVNQLPGVTSHNATRAWGGTDHTDPGKDFPWDVFLRYVQEAMNPPKPQPKPEPIPLPKENDMTPEQDRILRENNQMLKLVLAQLGGPKDFNGWPQGGNRTQYDLTAAIAERVGVAGTRDMRGGDN